MTLFPGEGLGYRNDAYVSAGPGISRMRNDLSRSTVVETDVPARLDALPWARFHTLVIVALGVTWVLDGLEVTLAGAVSGALKASPALRLTDSEVGLSASAYLIGAVLGALVFGW